MTIVPGERRPFRHSSTTARSRQSITLTGSFMQYWTSVAGENYHDTHERFAPFYAPPTQSLRIIRDSG